MFSIQCTPMLFTKLKENLVGEPLRVSDVTEEMKQFNMAMDTLSGFLQMMQPVRTGSVSMSRCRFYAKIFEQCMEQLDREHLIVDGINPV